MARDLHTDTEQRIGELLTKVLPDHHPLDILRVRVFARSEPKDVSSDYVEQEASKGKRAFIQALWTLYVKSSLYRLAYKAWKRQGPQNLTTWTLLAQAVDVMQRNDPIPCFKSPMYAPSVRCTGQKRHTMAMGFTCNVCCNT
ncbi:hypothetical protein TNCV_1813391 [Trichonephila clavipes]|uniref:Uncharacterized protein n=1 Tax=Trichonephila clavipes TaxID=2585209 RepID=A0A8X7BGR4_TRICX|nr:hypothetical protein TNCV_1813391 [Trichonephila clavipes]